MTQEKMAPLRANDRRYACSRNGDKAQKAHIRAIKDVAGFLKRSPATATPDDLRAYQLDMTNTGVTLPTYNARIMALRIFFGAWLRASEVGNFEVSDIDSDRMLIHVDEGKDPKDRKVMLSPDLRDLLRNDWCEARPEGWLSPM